MTRERCAFCDLTADLAALESTDLRGLVSVLTGYAIRNLGVSAADVLLFDAPTQKLVNAGGRSFQHSIEGKTLRLDDSLAGQVVIGRSPIRLAHLARAKNDYANIPDLITEGFVMYAGAPLIAHNQVRGVLEVFCRDSVNPHNGWFDALAEIAEKTAPALDHVLLARRLQRANTDLAQGIDALIEGWSNALELRDFEPQGHTMRVTEYTVEFAHLVGVPDAELVHVRRGALLHDVGKMGIPDQILLKTESLSDDEWAVMRQHPLIGYQFLAEVEILKPALDIPRYHHERWDGAGYPHGLKGEQIPFAARLFSIVDVWDTLKSDRPYRKGWVDEKVRQFIHDVGGRQFDPDLADKFLKLLEGGDKRRHSEEAQYSRTYQDVRFNV